MTSIRLWILTAVFLEVVVICALVALPVYWVRISGAGGGDGGNAIANLGSAGDGVLVNGDLGIQRAIAVGLILFHGSDLARRAAVGEALKTTSQFAFLLGSRLAIDSESDISKCLGKALAEGQRFLHVKDHAMPRGFHKELALKFDLNPVKAKAVAISLGREFARDGTSIGILTSIYDLIAECKIASLTLTNALWLEIAEKIYRSPN